MARYIDADKLVAWCMRTYQAQSDVAGKASVNVFLTAVDSCPTEDVVPRSEVEELKAIIADHKASEERLEELYSNAKAELAREIFEDVKKAIKEEVRDYCNGFERMQTHEMQEYYKTKQNTAIYLYMKIDHLEKKYTKGAAGDGGKD